MRLSRPSFPFLPPHDVVTSLQLFTDCGLLKTLKRLENFCVLLDMCVCVC
jgi:hypothetical protein